MSRRALASSFRAGISSWSRSCSPAIPILSRGLAIPAWQSEKDRSNPDNYAILFPQTTSDPLNDILAKTLLQVILPSHLPMAQRKQIIRGRYAQRLRKSPIVMEIEGSEHKLEHVGSAVKIPSNDELVAALEEYAHNSQDWKVLPNLMSGLEHANRPLNHRRLLKIIQVAGKKGHIYAIIDCARRVKKTGLRLHSRGLASLILYWVQRKAMDSGWDGKQTDQAITWAENILRMLEDPDHRHEKEKFRSPFPIHKEPLILASVLHLVAGRAAAHFGGKDEDGQVAKYGRLVADNWREDRGIRSIELAQPPNRAAENTAFHSPNAYLSTASPALKGIELAATQVAEPELAERLRTIAAALREEVEKTLAESEESATQGVETYRLLFQSDGRTDTEEPTQAQS